MSTIRLRVITPNKHLLIDGGDLVVIPTKNGEVGIQAQHVPSLVTVVPGSLRYRFPVEDSHATEKEKWLYLFVSVGYAEITPVQVTVLVTASEFPSDIDVERSRRALARGEERMKRSKQGSRDWLHGKHAIRRAKGRLHIAERYAEAEGGHPPANLEELSDGTWPTGPNIKPKTTK